MACGQFLWDPYIYSLVHVTPNLHHTTLTTQYSDSSPVVTANVSHAWLMIVMWYHVSCLTHCNKIFSTHPGLLVMYICMSGVAITVILLGYIYVSLQLQVHTTLQHPTQYHVEALWQKNIDHYLDTSSSNHFAGTGSSPSFQSGTSPHGYQGNSPR